MGVLFDRYARLFLGIAYRILRDRGEAEFTSPHVIPYVSSRTAGKNTSGKLDAKYICSLPGESVFSMKETQQKYTKYAGTEHCGAPKQHQQQLHSLQVYLLTPREIGA